MAAISILEKPTGHAPAAAYRADPVAHGAAPSKAAQAVAGHSAKTQGASKKQLRSVAKTALGVGLGLLALTGLGGSRALKVHTVAGFAFVALSLWHVSLYKSHKKSCA